jgi:hypothetical protein
MKTKFRRGLSLLAIASLSGVSIFAGSAHFASGADAAKPSIEDVMKKAFKGKGKDKSTALVAIVASGKGTPEQNKQMVEACEALVGQKPPKGDQKEWDKRCADLLAAAKAVAGGDKKAGMTLQKAADCKACHTAHKE